MKPTRKGAEARKREELRTTSGANGTIGGTLIGVLEPTAFAFGGLVCSIVGLTDGGAKLRRRLVAKV